MLKMLINNNHKWSNLAHWYPKWCADGAGHKFSNSLCPPPTRVHSWKSTGLAGGCWRVTSLVGGMSVSVGCLSVFWWCKYLLRPFYTSKSSAEVVVQVQLVLNKLKTHSETEDDTEVLNWTNSFGISIFLGHWGYYTGGLFRLLYLS